MRMSWDEAVKRIAAGEDIEAVLDERSAAEAASFVGYLRSEGRPDLADKHQALVREIDTGIYGARATWHALSVAQRRTLAEAASSGGRVDRVGKDYRHKNRNQPYKPVYVATIRNLCARDLMSWDGGAFDPEAVAVVTERGRFVLKHGVDA
jgi:hypothetical protein